eukprot:TRINITY_DN8764_c0_g1_i1.p1 TRINITY_DN8764_c0_g1~~TRINITY_DN8764_c0_g1_i1.p1  ORF type:complete len:136 (-),score=21.69 TRINITY_DN8764_c0_g1_i1:71-478(-)
MLALDSILDNIEDVALMNRVLDSPRYIYNPSNPLNPHPDKPFMEHEAADETRMVDPSQPTQIFDFDMKSNNEPDFDITGMEDDKEILGSFPHPEDIAISEKHEPLEKDLIKTPKSRKKPVGDEKTKHVAKKIRVF